MKNLNLNHVQELCDFSEQSEEERGIGRVLSSFSLDVPSIEQILNYFPKGMF